VSRIPHPKVGWVPNISLPIRYSDTPMVDPTPAPAVGEHTLEVLRAVLGYDDRKVEELRCAGALGKDHRALTKESAS
jgi:crotonobetainyl-CoA:carnitine CoA-transferase CaiB-like acyl-CoA transferase